MQLAQSSPQSAARGHASAAGSRRRLTLARLVETEVLPRLVATRAPGAAWITAEHVAELTRRLLSRHDEASAAAFVATLRRDCVPVEPILVDLLTPAARRLGELWVDDRADFTQVTIGTIRLQRILDDLAPALNGAPGGAPGGIPGGAPGGAVRRALFAVAPGDQHGFGLSMVAAFFRAAGWAVTVVRHATVQAIADEAAARAHNVAVLAAGSSERLPALRDAIAAARRAARNRTMGVLVGGPAFLTDLGALRSDAAELVGADMATDDPRHAVRQAERLCAAPAGLADA